jgi:hypothetical protein
MTPLITALADLIEIRDLFEQHFGPTRCPCTCDLDSLIEQESQDAA